MSPTPITEALPAELRVRIYEHALLSQYPIKRQDFHWIPMDTEYTSEYGHLSKRRPVHGHETTAFIVSLLLACRLIYHEARPIFAKVNIFRVKRTEFCDGTALKVPTYTKLDLAHLTRLELYDLTPGSCCSLTGRSLYCQRCSNHGLELLTHLATLPHLRIVNLDYSETELTRAELDNDWTRSRRSESTFFELKDAIESSAGEPYGLEIACLGVGRYEMRGEGLGHLRITCTDNRLANAWKQILCRSYGSRQDVIEVTDAVNAIEWCEYNSRRIAEKLTLILLRNPPSFSPGSPATVKLKVLPEPITRIWVQQRAIDVESFEKLGSPEFLDRFNEALREYLLIPFEHVQWFQIA